MEILVDDTSNSRRGYKIYLQFRVCWSSRHEHENDLLVVQYISTTLWYYTTQIHANYLPLHHDIILRKYMQIHMMAQSYFAFSTKPY